MSTGTGRAGRTEKESMYEKVGKRPFDTLTIQMVVKMIKRLSIERKYDVTSQRNN